MPDFSQLLSQPVDSFERPKPIPAGTYHGRITTFSVKEAQNEKKTPFVRLDLSLDSAGDDIDPSAMEGIELAKRPQHVDYYLTPDSQYRIRELMEGLGITIIGRSLNETLPELTNQSVLISIVQRPNKDGTALFANVDKIAANKG